MALADQAEADAERAERRQKHAECLQGKRHPEKDGGELIDDEDVTEPEEEPEPEEIEV